MKCSACGVKEAVVSQPHTGRALCDTCFLFDIKERVRETARRFNMIGESDRVMLAVSGGKDSFVLLDVLSELLPAERVFALSIIEGIPGYNRLEDIEKLRRYAKERGVDLIVTSIKEFTGMSLAEIVRVARERGIGVSACTFCGGLRRKIINTCARMLGATKTATAHNLDDEVQTAILNLLRGDIGRLLRQHPNAPRLSEKFVQRIKPLRYVYEWEATMYSYLKGFRFQETECMYIVESPTLRARVRKWLYMLERESPGTMLRVLKAVDKLAERLLELHGRLPRLPQCSVCGEPTSYRRQYCKVCELLMAVGAKLAVKPQ
uniref:TIGR00269 family protein n=1 Tax=Fervidicoccus fontis TaxID=683846 RepID=A0A7J3ZK00_9CREN